MTVAKSIARILARRKRELLKRVGPSKNEQYPEPKRFGLFILYPKLPARIRKNSGTSENSVQPNIALNYKTHYSSYR